MGRTRFTLIELMIVVGIIAVLAGIAIPEFRAMQLRSKRAEVPLVVDGLRTTALGLIQSDYVFTYSPTKFHPDAKLDKSKKPWLPFPKNEGWDEMGFEADGHVYGQYMFVQFVPDLIHVEGTSDVDDDNIFFQHARRADPLDVFDTGPYALDGCVPFQSAECF